MPEKITQLHVKTDWLEINTTSIRFGPTKSEEGEQVYGRRYDASSNTEVGNWCLLPLFVNDGQVSKGIKTVLVGANGQMLSIPCNQIAPEGRDTTAILFLEDEKLSKKIEELTVEATSLQEQISRTAARLEAHQKETKKIARARATAIGIARIQAIARAIASNIARAKTIGRTVV